MLELKMIKTLFPQAARAWFVREGYILDLMTGIAKSFEDYRLWLEEIKNEGFPFLAEKSLPDWYKDYGIIYISEDSTSYKRQKLMAKVYQIGANNKTYIESVISKLGFLQIHIKEGIFEEENSCGVAEFGVSECGNWFSWFGIQDTFYGYYLVYGILDDVEKLKVLKDTLNEIVKATLQPIYYLNFWILETGFWNDKNFWMDGKNWNEAI